MDASNAYYKTKRNLLLFAGCLLLAIFAGFKIADADVKITILPFQLARPNYLTTILFSAVAFNLVQFSLNWAAQNSEVQQNRFHRYDFILTNSIGVFSVNCYLGWLAVSYFSVTFEGKHSVLAVLAIILGAVSFLVSTYVEWWVKGLGVRIKRKAASEEEELSEILKSQIWKLVYDPKTNTSKKITFENDGTTSRLVSRLVT
jgi:hypothetical protein